MCPIHGQFCTNLAVYNDRLRGGETDFRLSIAAFFYSDFDETMHMLYGNTNEAFPLFYNQCTRFDCIGREWKDHKIEK